MVADKLSQWDALLCGLLDAIRHGGLQEEWTAAGVLADYLAEQDTGTAVPYTVPFGGRNQPERWEETTEIARRIQECIAVEKEQCAANGGERSNPLVAVALATDGRVTGLLLPQRHYSYE